MLKNRVSNPRLIGKRPCISCKSLRYYEMCAEDSYIRENNGTFPISSLGWVSTTVLSDKSN